MLSVIRAAIAAGLGLASGFACSAMLVSDKDYLYGLGLVFAIAAVLSAGLSWRPGLWRSFFLVVIIGAAWPAAHFLSVYSFEPIGKFLGSNDETMAMRLALQVGNLVGGILTIIALAIAARVRPGIITILPALLAGAAAAYISILTKPDGLHADIAPQILLPGWQVTMLFFTVLGLDWQRQDIHGA